VRAPIDVATRVSSKLSAFIAKLVNDPEREDPPTLKDAQATLDQFRRRRTGSRRRFTTLRHGMHHALELLPLDRGPDFGVRATLISTTVGIFGSRFNFWHTEN
jgi:hypothetical protein